MTTLSGRSLQASFGELLKIDSTGLTTTLQSVEDGDGNTSPLMLSTLAISLNGLQWPTNNGQSGAVLTIGSNNMLNWSTIGQNQSIPTASYNTLGGVRLSTDFDIDGQGILSISSNFSSYSLPNATANVLGGIMVGSNLTVSSNGTLSALGYTLPKASSSQLGGVIVGSNLNVDTNGVLSAKSYSLPLATVASVGGVIVGSNLSIDTNGVLSANSYSLPTASTTAIGGVMVGSGLQIDSNGVLTALPTTTPTYTLPIGSSTVLGGVKIGAGINQAADGTISVPTSGPAQSVGGSTLVPGNILYSASNPGSGYLKINQPVLIPLGNSAYQNIQSFFPNNEWTAIETGATGKTKIFSSGGRMFIVAGYQITTSIDGMNWHTQTLTEQISCVTHGTTSDILITFIAGCVSGRFAHSTDGIHWNFTTPSVLEPVHSISANPYVATTTGSNGTLYSADNGITWQPLPTSHNIDQFVTNANYLVVGAPVNSNQAYTFVSSSSPSVQPIGSAALPPINNLTAYKTLFYFWNGIPSSSYISIFYTTDFTSAATYNIAISSSTPVSVTSMCWTLDDKLIVTTNSNIMLISTDGVNFTVVTTNVPTNVSTVVALNCDVYGLSAASDTFYSYKPADYDTTTYFKVSAMPSHFPSYIPYIKL